MPLILEVIIRMHEHSTLDARQERALTWVVIGLFSLVLTLLTTFWILIVSMSFDELRREMVARYPAALIGLPVAGLGAFMLVFVFRHTQGPIEFEAFTVKFRGAAGPIVFWMMVFLVTAAVIKILS